MSLRAEVADSFSRGVLNASTARRKVGRWLALVALWLMAILCLALIVTAPFVESGWSLFKAVFLLSSSAVVFAVVSVGLIFTFDLSERRWRS